MQNHETNETPDALNSDADRNQTVDLPPASQTREENASGEWAEAIDAPVPVDEHGHAIDDAASGHHAPAHGAADGAADNTTVSSDGHAARTREEDAVAENPVDADAEPADFTAFIDEYKTPIEALIFASDEPIMFKQLRLLLFGETAAAFTDESVDAAMPEEPGDDTAPETAAENVPTPAPTRRRRKKESGFTVNMLKAAVDALNTEYAAHGRSFRIIEVAGGFTFQTTPDVGVIVGRLFAERSKRRLTQSALETLSIIAFKQPLSKPAVEAIRGVNADFVIKSLLDRNLIAIVGRENSVGRPLLYGTTKTFLKHFGLKSLDDLPKPREIQDILSEENGLGNPSIDEPLEDEMAHYHHLSNEEKHIFDTVQLDTDAMQEDEAQSDVENIISDEVAVMSEEYQHSDDGGRPDGVGGGDEKGSEDEIDGTEDEIDGTEDEIDGTEDEIDGTEDEIDEKKDISADGEEDDQVDEEDEDEDEYEDDDDDDDEDEEDEYEDDDDENDDVDEDDEDDADDGDGDADAEDENEYDDDEDDEERKDMDDAPGTPAGAASVTRNGLRGLDE